MITLIISDLPTAHMISGFAAPTSQHLCSLCWLQKSDIGDFDVDDWKQRTSQEHCDAATWWRDAEMKVEQDRIFKKTGVCWSKLLHLPYWDPTGFLAMDGMHNILLALLEECSAMGTYVVVLELRYKMRTSVVLEDYTMM